MTRWGNEVQAFLKRRSAQPSEVTPASDVYQNAIEAAEASEQAAELATASAKKALMACPMGTEVRKAWVQATIAAREAVRNSRLAAFEAGRAQEWANAGALAQSRINAG
jgi:hypothetical protein